ncbi:MAG: SMI1/KNR4 family protein [Clostridium sp.]
MHDIEDVEKLFNISFPQKYIDFINSNSKYIDKINYTIKLKNEKIIIKKFLPIVGDTMETVYSAYCENRDLMLEGIIPIANAEYDDYICLYYKEENCVPKVILWSYELAIEDINEGIFHISDSFEQFLDLF